MDAPISPVLLVDIREVARRFGCSDRTIFTLTKNGSLPCVKIGRHVKYSPADLEAWIAKNRTTSTSTAS
jgi:excisionase family DNA binding protein